MLFKYDIHFKIVEIEKSYVIFFLKTVFIFTSFSSFYQFQINFSSTIILEYPIFTEKRQI